MCQFNLQTILNVGDVTEADATRELIGFLMHILAYPGQFPIQETVSKTTFYFWSIYVDAVTDPLTDELLHRYKELYFDLFVPLLQTVITKMQRVADDDEITGEDLKEFNEYVALMLRIHASNLKPN